MSAVASPAVLDSLLAPVARCLTAEAAARLVSLRADEKTQARLDELADKANEGELTEDEHAEYASYVSAMNLIGVLQARARRLLSEATRV